MGNAHEKNTIHPIVAEFQFFLCSKGRSTHSEHKEPIDGSFRNQCRFDGKRENRNSSYRHKLVQFFIGAVGNTQSKHQCRSQFKSNDKKQLHQCHRCRSIGVFVQRVRFDHRFHRKHTIRKKIC